jgi:PAS domain S-box-containing protein/putative nucleotidyltransferase with HDIG domain
MDARERKPTPQPPDQQGWFRTLVENAPDIIARFDRSLRHLYVNPVVGDKLGIPPEAFLGRTHRELGIPEELCAQYEAVLRAVFETGELRTLETTFPGPDGSVRYYQARVVPERAADGTVASVLVVARDVTDMKLIEERLRRSIASLEALHEASVALLQGIGTEQVLRTLVERAGWLCGAPHGFVSLVEGDQLVLRVGTGVFEDHVGVRLDRGEGLSGKVWERDAAIVVDDYRTWPGRAAKYNAVPFHAACGLPLRARGRVIGVLGLAHTDPAPRFGREAIETLVRFADLACIALELAQEHERAQATAAELARREAWYRTLFEKSSDAVILTGPEGTVRYASPSVETVLGYPPEEVVGRNALEVLRPDHAEQTAAELPGFLSTPGAERSFAVRARHRDGSWRVLEGVVRNLVDDPVVGAVAVNFRDVTERRRAERRLCQRTAELEALFEFSGRLRAAASPEEMYPIVVEHALALGRSDHGALALLDPVWEGFTFVCVRGVLREIEGMRLPTDSLLGQVLRSGAPLRLDAFPEDALVRIPYPHGLGPAAIVPVRSEERTLGTLSVARRAGAPPYTDEEVRLLQALTEIAGNAIRRAGAVAMLENAYIELVVALGRAMDARDHYTAGHSERLSRWVEALARRLGCSEQEVQDMRWAALLHDIGKIGIPDSILRKPGPLTPEEWAPMRQHPVIGERILAAVPRLETVARIVRSHHERWDGTGYPDGLAGEEIPLASRIIAVVDAYVAQTDARPYRPARGHDEAVEELRRCAGTQFDPRIVDAFLELLQEERTCVPSLRS